MSQKHHSFNAAVGRVLQLMIHSIYTNKEIFLRELISNSSDACDKLRYLAIENPKLLGSDDFKIEVKIEDNKVIVSDNGIGMSEEELIENLGTIANSGTKQFFEKMTDNKELDVNLIGQFGVGFYSGFIVADKIKVFSTKAGSDKTYIWESNGTDGFEVYESVEKLPRGTKIELYVKDSEVEFLEKFRLQHIIRTYSDHLTFPVELIDQDGKGEIINRGTALWLRPKSDVSDREYREFYKYVANAPDEPYMVLHNKLEGNISYSSLLFIPGHKPYDLFHPDRKTRVKLYIKRVFITENSAMLIPSYLRFIRGVVDSDDLPLNISREVLQSNSLVNKIRGSIVKRVLLELKRKAEKEPEEFIKFWQNFGEVMKEGLCEHGLGEKEELLEVCRFYTTKSGNDIISIDQYIDNMIDGQEDIFFITGDNLEMLGKSPQLEGFLKRGIEVLLLKDPVDDFWVHVINAYKNKSLKSVNRIDIDLDQIKNLKEESGISDESKESNEQLIDYIKSILNNRVKDVKISSKLIDSPSCLVLPEGAMNVRMERLLVEQKQLNRRTTKILEVNPNHKIVQYISDAVKNSRVSDTTSDLVEIIFYEACLNEGEIIENPCDFVSKINRIFSERL
jgi:molecular chaperone HtpG